jgi:hypothetical protein
LTVVGVVTIVAVVAVIGGVALSRRMRSGPSSASCDVPTSPPSGISAPATQAPGGGGLRVIEKGFSQVGTKGLTVSLGALLENTSTQVAYRSRITFRVFDAQHASAVPPDHDKYVIQEIPVVLPGQRIGVGAWSYVRDDPSGRPARVSGFEVDLGTAQWMPRDKGAFAQISTRHQRTERSPVEQETGTIHYSVESAYCRALAPRGVAAVFRNSAGTVIGGSFEWALIPPRCLPGTSAESVGTFRSIPPDIDDSRTESYPYCDVAPAGPRTKASDAPIN